MKLSLAKLAVLKGVATPTYDRAALTPGILHIGISNFHRGHQAVYMDDLFNQGLDQDWAILGAGVSNGARNVRKAIEDQDWLTTVVERDGEGSKARVISSIVDFVPVDLENYTPLKEALLNPNIKIVSTTVTEGGYYQDPSTGKFDQNHPRIVEDAKNPDNPTTIFGLIVQALKKRRETVGDDAPFTLMCCDNVPHGGDVFKEGVVGLAAMNDKEHAEWIENNISFPNGMVDRIVPKTGDPERKTIQDDYGYTDDWPIFCEPFRQWVLEDNFCAGRPALEKVGVTFVKDVNPYENAKIRILNGGHASLCYPSALLGLEYVHNAMEHPVIGPFVDTVERTEIIPGVLPVPDTDLEEYWEIIQGRFINPTICDRIDRNCAQGSARQPTFIVPPAMDCVKDGRKVDGLALISAMWCRYCQGTVEDGTPFEPDDKAWDRMHEMAMKAKDDPALWLGMTDIYGDLGSKPAFADAFVAAFQAINKDGVEATMQNYIDKNKA